MSVRGDIDHLTALAGDYSPGAIAERLVLIARLSRVPLRSAPLLKRFHSLLLHTLAFPDDADTLDLVQAVLAAFPRRIARAGHGARRALLHSGIAGTRVDYPFTCVNARFMARRWPDDVHFDWAAFDGAAKLDPVLQALVGPGEMNVFDEGSVSTADWIRLATGRRRGVEPAWLFRQCDEAKLDPVFTEWVYNEAEVPLRWVLAPDAARTGNRMAPRWPALRTAMRRLPADVPAWIKGWSGAHHHCSVAEGRRVIDTVQAALLVRCREVFAHQHANPADVWRVDLGAGTEVVFLGSLPARRLGLEANFGYMLFAGGVPLGYGGVTALLGQGNTGANIFEEFRRGESAFLYASVLGAARSLFGCERFIVNPYQFGADNPEAISSGAFWFYYRLGFRPVDATIRARAGKEFRRLTARRGARTAPAMLREFAGGDLELVLPGYERQPRFEERWLGVLAERATASLATAAPGSRRQALARLVADVTDRAGLHTAGWNRAEHSSLRHFAPLLALVPDLARWPAPDRLDLADLIRAKAAASERAYAQRMARHRGLRRALARAAR